MKKPRLRLKFKGRGSEQEDQASFTPQNVVNLFIAYKLDTWSRDLNTNCSIKHCLFGAAKLSKNVNPDKHKCRNYRIGFDSSSEFSLPDGRWVKM